MKILKNAIITPDGTELRSYHRHDYKTYWDTLTDKLYGVDGGTDYCKRVGAMDYKDASVFDNGNHEVVREHFVWGTYGKNQEFTEPKYVPLKLIGDEHLQAILLHIDVQIARQDWVKREEVDSIRYIENEIEYRKQNNITVEETTYV